MKKVFLLIVLISLVVLTVPDKTYAQSNLSGLQINPSNSHYFVYNGQPRMFITYALSGGMATSASRYNTMQSSNMNNRRSFILMTATNRPTNPYNNENINNGWNASVWTQAVDNAQWALERDITIGFQFWSTPMIEQGTTPTGRWGSHNWNECNGGPIPDNCSIATSGKDNFYTFDQYGAQFEITEPYDDSWSWQKKNRYYQEQLVKKYLQEFRNFPNVYFIPMYEIGDFWGVSGYDGGSPPAKACNWHKHIADLIKKYQPDRLVATVFGGLDKHEVGEWPEIDFILFEGPSLKYIGANDDIKDAYWDLNKPLAWDFIHPCGGTSRFPSNCEDDPDPKKIMHNAVIHGVHPSTRSGWETEQNDYAQRLGDFIRVDPSIPDRGIETWCDEPGQEITSSAVPSVSGGSGTDLPPGSCSDDGSYPSPTPRSTPTPLEGDIDQDGDVDIFDYNLLVTNFGSTNCGNAADVNGDCKVDIFDYNLLVENFGS